MLPMKELCQYIEVLKLEQTQEEEASLKLEKVISLWGSNLQIRHCFVLVFFVSRSSGERKEDVERKK